MSRTRRGQKSPGRDEGPPRGQACRWAPPGPALPGASGSDLRGSPVKPAPPLPPGGRAAFASLPAPKPHGPPCPFIPDDQSCSCRSPQQAPLEYTCVFKFGSAHCPGLTCPVSGLRCALPRAGRDRHVAQPQPPPLLPGSRVTWHAGPLLPGWVEAGRTGCGARRTVGRLG